MTHRKSRNKKYTVAALSVWASVAVGCSGDVGWSEDEDLGEDQSALITKAQWKDSCVTYNLVDFNKEQSRRPFIVTDQAIVADPKFSITRVLRRLAEAKRGLTSTTDKQRLAVTAAEKASELAEANKLWQQMTNSFDDADGRGAQGYGVPKRLPEVRFSDDLTKFKLVAIVNRFDLASADGSTCGEARLVYALQGLPGSRGTVIFEGLVRNPNPKAANHQGCQDLWWLWSTLPTMTPAKAAQTLSTIFFEGRGGATEVIHPHRFGDTGTAGKPGKPSGGQIRTNFFAESDTWNLREFQLTFDAATPTQVKVVPVPVKDNPTAGLFITTSAHPQQDAFQTAFLAKVPSLARANRANVSLDMDPRFFPLESTSSGAVSVSYETAANADFLKLVQAKIPAGTGVNAAQVLQRAEAATCAGCHQTATGAGFGKLAAAASLGFVHIDENRTLSPALKSVFLPARKETMIGVCTRTGVFAKPAPAAALLDANLNISGNPIGSPN